MAKNQNSSNDESLNKLIRLGCNITGCATGAIAGFIVGGPGGAALGAAQAPLVSSALYEIVSEIGQRHLSKREEERVGTTLCYAVENIRKKLYEGNQIRQDNFFIRDVNNRSSAEEITEGVLIAAQSEHEEKKLKYYGNLIANLAFTNDYDKTQANFLIKTAQQLTYRQLCLVNIFCNNGKYSLRDRNYRDQENFELSISVLEVISTF